MVGSSRAALVWVVLVDMADIVAVVVDAAAADIAAVDFHVERPCAEVSQLAMRKRRTCCVGLEEEVMEL